MGKLSFDYGGRRGSSLYRDWPLPEYAHSNGCLTANIIVLKTLDLNFVLLPFVELLDICSTKTGCG